MIDHVVMLVEAEGPEIQYLASLRLVETYRRTHPGQGTQNICYCFDNLFLELLWIKDVEEVRSDLIQRTRLYERSLWRTQGTCPFGIAWRRSPAFPATAIQTWEFQPPYLPAGISIPIAVDSDDPRQPLIFESPGGKPPIEWPPEKRGSLQHEGELGSVTEITLTMPPTTPQCGALLAIAQSQEPPVRLNEPADGSQAYRLDLRVASLIGKADSKITLPIPR